MNIAIPPESEGLGAAAAAIPKDAQAAAKPKYRFLPKTHTHKPHHLFSCLLKAFLLNMFCLTYCSFLS